MAQISEQQETASEGSPEPQKSGKCTMKSQSLNQLLGLLRVGVLHKHRQQISLSFLIGWGIPIIMYKSSVYFKGPQIVSIKKTLSVPSQNTKLCQPFLISIENT